MDIMAISIQLEVSGMMPGEPNDKRSQQTEFMRNLIRGRVPQTSASGQMLQDVIKRDKGFGNDYDHRVLAQGKA
jgi:hypothetical protein